MKTHYWGYSEQAQCRSLYESGLTHQAIADSMGRSRNAVSHYITRWIKNPEQRKIDADEKYGQISNPNITESQKGYIGGIVDGEGCIYISKNKNLKCKQQISYSIGVDVCNTNYLMVKFLQDNLGGYIQTGHRPNRKIYYKWSVRGVFAEKFLIMIYDYLLIKKNQADIVLDFRKLFTHREFVDGEFTVEYQEKRESAYQALKALKGKEYE